MPRPLLASSLSPHSCSLLSPGKNAALRTASIRAQPSASRPFSGGNDEEAGMKPQKKAAGFTTSGLFLALNGGQHFLRQLIGPRAEEKINQVTFMRLQPIQSIRRNLANVEPIDVRRIR